MLQLDNKVGLIVKYDYESLPQKDAKNRPCVGIKHKGFCKITYRSLYNSDLTI